MTATKIEENARDLVPPKVDPEIFRGVILSREPPIFSTETYAASPFIGDARKIASLLPKSKLTIFVVPAASMLGRDLEKRGKAELEQFKAEFPNVRIALLANDPQEVSLASSVGFEAHFINQNAFVDERLFVPTGAERQFDAIYNAQLLPFKRHHLAKLVKRLALVYYGKKGDYYQSVRSTLSHAYFANEERRPASREDNIIRFLPAREVSELNSSSHVGLCLSAREGAMYASAEYLLCGIPVVSTPNVGGRDVFFDEYNCLECDDNAEAVAAAVDRMMSRTVSPARIRAHFMSQAVQVRDRFFSLINDIRRQHGVKGTDFEQEFMTKIFSDKLWKQKNKVSDILAMVE